MSARRERSSACRRLRLRAAKGASAEFGFTVDNVVASAKALLQAHGT